MTLFLVLYICLSVWMSICYVTNRYDESLSLPKTGLYFIYYFVMWPISSLWCLYQTYKDKLFRK